MTWSDEARRESARVRHLKALLRARWKKKGRLRALPVTTRVMAERAKNVALRREREQKNERVRLSSGDIMVLTMERTGFTYKLRGEVPHTGKVVSAHPECEEVYPAGSNMAAELRSYQRRQHKTLSRPGRYLGTWIDEETGELYFDVVQIVHDQGVARRLSEKHQQRGYYDLDADEFVEVLTVEEKKAAAREGP